MNVDGGGGGGYQRPKIKKGLKKGLIKHRHKFTVGLGVMNLNLENH